MALKNKPITVQYTAWNTATNQPQTGDVANHTLKLIQDGAEGTPTNAPTQVDAGGAPGVYSLALVAGDMNYNCVTLCGVSSTTGVYIMPLVIITEQGLIDANTSSRAAPAQILANPGYLLATDSTGAAIANVLRWANQDVPTPVVAGVPQVDVEYGGGYGFGIGTAQGGTADTIQLQAGSSTVDGWYVNTGISIISGTGAGQTPRVVTAYVGAELQATVTPPWITVPDMTSVYELGGSAYAELDMTQAIPTTNTPQTVGDALNAARAQGFGAWTLAGTTLTLYAGDGVTVVRTFTIALDANNNPAGRS